MSRVENILNGIAASDRVAGAYLFLGPPGAGKKTAAELFTAVLECKKQDIIRIAPDGASLKIEQIRELQEWTKYGPTASRYLLVLVEQADKMTGQAAAAFLKTLEEPAPGVVFVLLATRLEQIPTTIVSRCQQLLFPEPERKWQPAPTNSAWYGELKGLKQKSHLELFHLSSRLEKEKDKLEELLYDLVYFVRYELTNHRMSRVILETIRQIKRRANARLALDLMCLKLAQVGGK